MVGERPGPRRGEDLPSPGPRRGEDLPSEDGARTPRLHQFTAPMVTEEKTALSPSNPAQHLTPDITIEDVAEQVRSWLHAASTRSVPAPAQLLSDLLRDPHGLEFTLAFVDRVIRPEDPKAAAVELRRLAQDRSEERRGGKEGTSRGVGCADNAR